MKEMQEEDEPRELEHGFKASIILKKHRQNEAKLLFLMLFF